MRIVLALGWGLIALLAAATSSCEGGDDDDCAHECPSAGTFACASPADNGLVVCADFDDDECLEWGGFVACDAGESCASADCVGGCANECPAAGERNCEADGYRECGEHDGDGCHEWSDVIACPATETCSNGICSGSCADECDDGDQPCDGDGFKTCGQHDTDPCRDWSTITPCKDGEACDDGKCEPQQCTEEGEDCVCGDDECCEGHCCPVLFICVSFPPDEDFCF